MNKEIIELVEKCDLVKIGHEDNGHDCWGNSEYSSYKYVFINNEKIRVWDGWYIIHDGEKVVEIITKFLLDSREREKEHLEKTGFKTPSEYKAYLIGKNENNKNIDK